MASGNFVGAGSGSAGGSCDRACLVADRSERVRRQSSGRTGSLADWTERRCPSRGAWVAGYSGALDAAEGSAEDRISGSLAGRRRPSYRLRGVEDRTDAGGEL